MLLNAVDFDSVQDALDRAVTGDRIYLPGIKVYAAPIAGWRIEKGVEIYGDGPGVGSGYAGTVVVPSSSSGDVFVLSPKAPRAVGGGALTGVHIHDLHITRPQGVSGHYGRNAVRFAAADDAPFQSKLTDLRMSRVAISWMGGDGIVLAGEAAESQHVVGVYLVGCDISMCAQQGLRMSRSYQANIVSSRFAANGAEGLAADGFSEVTLYACSFDANRGSGGQAEASINLASLASLVACRFANFESGANPRACLLTSCGGFGQVEACVFDLSVSSSSAVGVEVAGLAAGGPINLGTNRFINVGTAIKAPEPPMPLAVPQYSDPASTIDLTVASGGVPIAIPSENRVAGNSLSGLLLPELPALPDSSSSPSRVLVDGMIVYVDGKLWILNDGAWSEVRTTAFP